MPPSSILKRASNDCVNPDPDNTLTDRMNLALNSSGAGFVLSLCPSTTYVILAPIKFAAPNQEISTVGYPTGDERATLVVFGPVFNGTGHSTAVDGTCANCDGVKLRNVQASFMTIMGSYGVLLLFLDQWHAQWRTALERRC